MLILAIDQGTTSTRALTLDETGTASVVCSISHQQYYPHPGWVEHDPQELLDNIYQCIESVEHIDALGIANQGESCLAWHADTAEPICRVIVWQDNRSSAQIERLRKKGAQSVIEQKTGLPLDSYFSASKFAWIMQHIPIAQSLLAQGKLRLGTSDAFFLDRLTGNFVTDITTASRTSLMNLATGEWDLELCELFGVPIQALPKIVPCVGSFGVLNYRQRSIKVTASIVDQQASLYGHRCQHPGDAKVTFGTGAFAMLLTGKESFRAPERGLLPTVAWQMNNQAPVYALDGGVHCASSAINWAKKLGLFADYTELNYFDRAPAITRNLVFVPALTGLACPHWDRTAAGMWIGLSLDTDKQDMLQAILEGVAMRAAQVIAAMSHFKTFSGRLSIDGGMSRNPYFCQFLADTLQCEVQVPKFSEITALGVAQLVKLGQGDSSIEAVSTDHRVLKADLAETGHTGNVSIDTSEKIHQQVSIYQPNSDLSDYMKKFNAAIERSKNWAL